jgi:hypothetical protein
LSQLAKQMSLWLQNLIVLLAVIACVAFIVRGAFRALQGRRSSLSACGSCNGCGPKTEQDSSKPKPERVVFLPAELLVKRRS